ncbi:MAG: hypothetical protein ACRC5F_06065, partial [Cetobacterium sp.]
MKNMIFLGALLSALLISGCTATDSKLESKIIQKTKIYGVKDTGTKDYKLSLTGNKVVSEKYNLDIEFKERWIDVSIENISKEVIFINWSDAKYIGFDGTEQRLFNLAQKDKGFYTKAMDSGIRPGQNVKVSLVPIKNLNVMFGSSTSSQEIFVEKALFSNEEREKKYAEVVIPVSLNSRKGGVVNNTVYFGNEEVPKEVVTILEKKPVKSVELKKIESRKI